MKIFDLNTQSVIKEFKDALHLVNSEFDDITGKTKAICVLKVDRLTRINLNANATDRQF